MSVILMRDGDTFERVAPCGTKRFPQPGDRYMARTPWDTITGLVAVGHTLGDLYYVEASEALSDPEKWIRVDLAAVPSMLDVLAEELHGLMAVTK